ncbi:MAG: amino acid ABC transporter substrate-binding protein, partial [Hyphomicrobiaceae bacterium]
MHSRPKVLTSVAGLLAAVVVPLCLAAFVQPASASTLEAVRARGVLSCGVGANAPGYAAMDRFGGWAGIDIEFCRAVAAAVLGDPGKVEVVALPPREIFLALRSGRIDLLARGPTWTLSRDTEFPVRFVGVLVYDGQGFLVPKSHGIGSALELSGASICVASGTRADEAMMAYFGRQRMRVQIVTSERWADLITAYSSGGCTALTAEQTVLADVRRTLAKPDDHAILPEIISKEPVGPAVRTGDDQWSSIVRWVLMALIVAEELDVSRSNLDARAGSQIEDVRRLLGVGSNLGASLGLPPDWARRVIAAVGNYGE